MKGYSAFPKIQHYWNLTIKLFSVIPGHSLGGVGSYPSAEMQSVYSIAPAEWSEGIKGDFDTHKFILRSHGKQYSRWKKPDAGRKNHIGQWPGSNSSVRKLLIDEINTAIIIFCDPLMSSLI